MKPVLRGRNLGCGLPPEVIHSVTDSVATADFEVAARCDHGDDRLRSVLTPECGYSTAQRPSVKHVWIVAQVFA